MNVVDLIEALESDDEWGLTNDFDQAGSPEEARISSLKHNRDELLIKYTKNHPYIKAIDSTIKELEQRMQENELPADEGPDMEAMSNPYVQSIKAQLNQVDAEIATLNSRTERFKKLENLLPSGDTRGVFPSNPSCIPDRYLQAPGAGGLPGCRRGSVDVP